MSGPGKPRFGVTYELRDLRSREGFAFERRVVWAREDYHYFVGLYVLCVKDGEVETDDAFGEVWFPKICWADILEPALVVPLELTEEDYGD